MKFLLFLLTLVPTLMAQDQQLITKALQDLPSSLDIGESCFDLFRDFSELLDTKHEILGNIFRYSGKDYNDLGSFSDCTEKSDNFRYTLLTCAEEKCGGKFSSTLSVGICLPKQCEASDLMSVLPFLLPMINEMIIPYEFKDDIAQMKEKGLSVEFKDASDFIVVDSLLENNKVTKFGFGSFVVVSIILILLTMVIGASVMHFLGEKEAIKRKQMEDAERALLRQKNRTLSRAQAVEIEEEEDDENLEIEQDDSDKKSFKSLIIRSFAVQKTIAKLSEPCFNKEDRELEILNFMKVYCITLIVFGNTYLFTLSGPLQNIHVVQSWTEGFIFSFVLQSDLMCDLFYWITAFVWSFQILKLLMRNDGESPIALWKIQLARYLRLAPQYYFMILFLWKIIALFGGSGPRFYQFEENHGCGDTWFWHFTFLNNLIPWDRPSNCLQQTWYLANDLQFFALLLFLSNLFYKDKKKFYIVVGAISGVCFLIQLIVICSSDLSASYRTHNDEYWTNYYYKPYTRLHGYLIGVVLGCEYFSYKYENKNQAGADDTSEEGASTKFKLSAKIHSFFDQLVAQKGLTIAVICIGFMMTFIIQLFHHYVNNHPTNLSLFMTIVYLTFARPIFVSGYALMLLPILLGNVSTKPIRRLMQHRFFVPQARLTYGIFLCNSVFMQFHIFNSEHGLWLQWYDTYLMYMAYFNFSSIFSVMTYILIEGPVSLMIKEIREGYELKWKQTKKEKGKKISLED